MVNEEGARDGHAACTSTSRPYIGPITQGSRYSTANIYANVKVEFNLLPGRIPTHRSIP